MKSNPKSHKVGGSRGGKKGAKAALDQGKAISGVEKKFRSPQKGREGRQIQTEEGFVDSGRVLKAQQAQTEWGGRVGG